LGVGIIADLALDSSGSDADLVSIDASHLFPVHTTWIGYAKDTLLRRYMYDFLGLLAPHLTRRLVDKASGAKTQAEIDELFSEVELPVR